VSPAPSSELDLRPRLHLGIQREITRLISPISFLVIWIALRLVLGYRIENLHEVRRAYRGIWQKSDAPLLVCANHLTMIDSFLITWSLGSPVWFTWHFAAVPWNVPERVNFAATVWQRVLIYALKCLPIQRGGRRSEVAGVLTRLSYLLTRGDTALIFPEGGRSRTGRIEIESAATGVGRVIRSVPNCRVLCVYLRGRNQLGYSLMPARRDRFDVALAEIEPKTDASGLRASRNLALQVTRKLHELEAEVLGDR
jgi:1-acyl-sn-glycerol-3-phosphate acyltransferase